MQAYPSFHARGAVSSVRLLLEPGTEEETLFEAAAAVQQSRVLGATRSAYKSVQGWFRGPWRENELFILSPRMVSTVGTPLTAAEL